MNKVEGNVCFFHRQSDNKWLWFIADSYGRSIIKSVEPFDTYEDAIMDYDIHKDELLARIDLGRKDPFREFFNQQ